MTEYPVSNSKSKVETSLAIFIILAIGLKLAVFFYYAWPFTTDDAFISWRYADHLANGDGIRWNLYAEPVEGYSNFLWMIVASVFITLGLPIITAIKCFSLVSLLAALFFLYQLSRTFLPPLLAILPLYLFSHYNGVVWWTVSGLETSFFVAGVLFVNWQCVRAMKNKLRPYAWTLTCIGLTLLALTRFEGAGWALIILIFVACKLWQDNKSLKPLSVDEAPISRVLGHVDNASIQTLRPATCSRDPKVSLSTQQPCSALDRDGSREQVAGRRDLSYQRPLLIFLLFFVLPYILYFSWRLFYFQRVLPNSYLCKAMASGFGFELLIDYLPIAFPCFIVGLPYLLSGKDCRKILLWLPSLLYALLLYHASPNIAYYNRLFLPAFAVLTLLPVLGIREFFSYFHLKTKNNAIACTVFILLFTEILIPGNQLSIIKTAVKHYEQRTAMRLKVAQTINNGTTGGDKILLADTGMIPFYARNDVQFIDSLCLNNKEMATMKIHPSKITYTDILQNTIKPDWIIDTYYPEWHHGNQLNEELRNKGFYKHYQLIKTYQSHRFIYHKDGLKEQEADFVYQIYKKQ